MSWYKKIIAIQMPPVWVDNWTRYLSQNFELLMGMNFNEYEPYLVELPKYNKTYEGLSVRIGMGKNIYRIIFRRRGNNLISAIILDNEALPSRPFDMLQESPSDIVNEIKEKIKGYSRRN